MLNSLHKVLEHHLERLLSIYANQLTAVFRINQLLEGSVLHEVLLDLRVSVFILVDESFQDGFVRDFFVEDVVVLIRHGIKSSLLEFFIDEVVAHFQSYEKIWLLIHLLQHGDLIICCWCSLQYPAIGFAIRHLESLLKEVHSDIVWNWFPILHQLTKL